MTSGIVTTRRNTGLIAGGAVLAVAVVAGAFFLLPRAPVAGADLGYLPADTEVIIAFRPEAWWRAPILSGLTSAPAAQKSAAELREKLGLGPEDIESIVMGVADLSKQPLTPDVVAAPPSLEKFSELPGVAVIRAKKPFDIAKLIEYAKQSGQTGGQAPAEAQHHGKTYYRTSLGTENEQIVAGAYFPDERTLVVGRETDIKVVLERTDLGQTPAKWQFLDLKQHLVLGVAPKDPSAFDGMPVPAEGAPEQVGRLQAALKGKVQGCAFGVTLGEGVDFQFQVNCLDATKSAEVKRDLDALLAELTTEARKQLDGMKQFPLPPPLPELADIGGKVVDSLVVRQKQTTVEIAGIVPASAKGALDQIPGFISGMFNPFGDMQNSDVGAFPGINQEPEPPPAPVVAIPPEEFDRGWKVDLDIENKTAGEIIHKLAEDAGLQLAPVNELAEVLSKPIVVRLKGGSRLEAIEAACREVGVHPAFDAVSPTRLTLNKGLRPWPVAFAGPFAIVVDKVYENVPHATGSLQLHVVAAGLPPSIVAALSKFDSKAIELTTVADAEGNDLRDLSDGAQMMFGGRPSVLYLQPLNIPLKNLLRSVKAVERVEGTLRFTLPTAVETVRFDSLEKGTQVTSGNMEFTVESFNAGEQSELTIVMRGVDLNAVELATYDSEDNALRNSGGFSGSIGEQATKNVYITGRPARAEVRVITESRPMEYKFQLPPIPLASAGKMPEKLEALQITGEAPVTLEFVKLSGDANFRNIVFKTTNHTNKPIQQIVLQIEYLDAAGKVLKDFPHSHGGEADMLPKQTSRELEIAAFFMPEETARAKAIVKRVRFTDATAWEAR